MSAEQSTDDTTQQPREQFVTLVSGDGQKFTISREAALQSGTLKSQLEVPSIGEQANPEVTLDAISGKVLRLVCDFLNERLMNPAMCEFKQLQAVDPTNADDKELVLELLLAADFLDC